jgi:hypothetical protein
MALTPVEHYHPRSEAKSSQHVGHAAAARLQVAGDTELPDATLTKMRGDQLKELEREWWLAFECQDDRSATEISHRQLGRMEARQMSEAPGRARNAAPNGVRREERYLRQRRKGAAVR